MLAGFIVTLAACNTTDTDPDDTNDPDNTNDPDDAEVIEDASLTDLSIDGTSIMGFDSATEAYTVVLSGDATAPVIDATQFDTTSDVTITNATDINSTVDSERTATITVTLADGSESMVYTILYETGIETVDLRSADDFVILAESAISSETASAVTGDIGVSPQAATYITGFSLIMDSTGTFATSSQITGEVFASDYTSPTPSNLTTAISDMRTAYTDAAGRTAHYTELYSGDLSGKTLTPGVYKFGTGVLVNTDLTLHGNATDVFIFQIDGSYTQASATAITLTGGALPENIVWQIADTVSIGTGAHFEGTVLAKTNIALGTGATMNGSLYAQTAVTLDAATVTKP